MKRISRNRKQEGLFVKMKNRRLYVTRFKDSFLIRAKSLAFNPDDGKLKFGEDEMALSYEAFAHLISMGIELMNHANKKQEGGR